MNLNFEAKKGALRSQFTKTHWIDDSGLATEELLPLVKKAEENYASREVAKAKTLELIVSRGRIAIDKDDIFQDKLEGGGIMLDQRTRWECEIKEKYLKAESDEASDAWNKFGTFQSSSDFGHTSPNTRLLLEIGLAGILERIENAAKRDGLTEKQKNFYESCRISISAVIALANRLADAIEPYNQDNAAALRNIASGAPKSTYEAMQLIVLYFFTHEYVAGTRVRTLGRLDLLLYPFYKKDIEDGRYSKAEIREMLKFFLYKFYAANVPFGLPFCIGGTLQDGSDATCEMSYLIVETFNELSIHSPKIHVRVSDRTPKDFVKLVLSCIRGGNSSFVFVNDEVGMESLRRVGIEELDARDFVPIGCYEPAVWGVEIGCTGNGGVNIAKAVELVLNNGRDFATGALCGVETEAPESFDEFLSAVKLQISHLTDKMTDYVKKIEKHYGEINPDPLLSAQYERSVERGIDVFEGGAKYNNSSVYFYCVASLIDSLCAVKKLVFDDKHCTLAELKEIMKNNWAGNERLRALALRMKEKYGNSNPTADALTADISHFCAELVNNKPNSRGGVFKAALFSIDFCFPLGKLTAATPDGRLAGEPLSKNLCATTAMDRNGITALINSVCVIDHADFSTGSVLDIVLHPSAVAGDDGLEAFYGILMTYMKKGGFAMHGNVFDARDLIKAQKNPEKYSNLQVRVCGWNAYFVNLSKDEQDAFIRQAQAAEN
ncbi:MAG: hypothetical protein IJW03_01090 [Clostridia bacterium]|nr:hypothetical protein [Clostridia bacterium]